MLAVILLGEAPTPEQLLGVALILSGLVLASARRRRPRAVAIVGGSGMGGGG